MQLITLDDAVKVLKQNKEFFADGCDNDDFIDDVIGNDLKQKCYSSDHFGMGYDKGVRDAINALLDWNERR